MKVRKVFMFTQVLLTEWEILQYKRRVKIIKNCGMCENMENLRGGYSCFAGRCYTTEVAVSHPVVNLHTFRPYDFS